MDGAQVEYIGRKLDRLIEVFEAVLEEVRWSHRDDPMPATAKGKK
jgi:hypothetical protein